MEAVFARLERCIAADNPNTAINVVFKLEKFRDERNRVPDELLDRLLDLLGTQRVLESMVAAQILNFFQFQSSRFTKRQKRRCMEFLSSKLNKFKDGDTMHVAYEIVHGNYLR